MATPISKTTANRTSAVFSQKCFFFAVGSIGVGFSEGSGFSGGSA